MPLRFRRNSTRQPHATTVARLAAIRVSFAHPDHCSQRMYSVCALSAAASKPRARQSCSTCGHAKATSISIENAGQLRLTLTQQANRALCASSAAFSAQCNMASTPNHVRVATSSGKPIRSHGRRPHRFVDLISLALSLRLASLQQPLHIIPVQLSSAARKIIPEHDAADVGIVLPALPDAEVMPNLMRSSCRIKALRATSHDAPLW